MGGQLDKRMLHWQPAKCSIFQLFIIICYLSNKVLLQVLLLSLSPFYRLQEFYLHHYYYYYRFLLLVSSVFVFFSSYISLLQIVVSEMTGMCWWEHKTVLTLTSVTSMRTLPSDCQLFVSHASTLTRDIDMGILSVRLSVCPSVRPRSSYSGIVSKRLCTYQMIQVHNSTWRRLMLRSICIVNCT